MKPICMVVQNVYDSDPRVRRKAEALVAAGYSVDVLALRREKGPACYTLNGVSVRTLAVQKKRGSLLRYLFEYATFFGWVFFRVPLLMRRRRYAVIDVNTLPDFLIFAAIVGRWMGAKLILDMHEITPEFYMSKYGIADRSLPVRLLKWLERVSFDFADYVITINEPIVELLEARGLAPSKATVVMNAADEGRFANARHLPDVGGGRPDGFVMMYHGTLTRTYGLDVAIEAFALVHEQMPGAEVWILGSGPEEGAIAALAECRGLSSKVKLLGQVPSSDIPAWLSQCGAGLLPFRRDVFLDYAFPNKLPEFIVAARPVLIARLNAVRHYFSERALAYFDPNDVSDLARQMVRVYRDRKLRMRLVARAAEEYAPIRWELMQQRYLALVDEAAGMVRKAAGQQHTALTALAK